MTDYWRPETLEELRSFIDNGVARESRRIEFKSEIPNTRSGNRTLARQLAAFAIEGGSIVIGVAEEADNQFTVTPVSFAGLRERVEQVAQSVIQPLCGWSHASLLTTMASMACFGSTYRSRQTHLIRSTVRTTSGATRKCVQ